MSAASHSRQWLVGGGPPPNGGCMPICSPAGPRFTALACHGRPIPPFHYMTAVAGGNDIRCAAYATFGTAELSALAVAALHDRLACLLAQHGQVTLGTTLDQALRIAIEVETLARIYLQALQLGEPPLLTAAQMDSVHAQFRSLHYGAGA